MALLYRLRAFLAITFKRLWSQRALTLATLLGLTTAVALIMTVPLYADAVYFRILQEELSTSADRVHKPPFAYFYDYIGAYDGSLQWADIQPANDYLLGSGGRALGLPQTLAVRHLETSRFRLYPAGNESYADDASLGTISFATTTSLESHIELLEGRLPEGGAADVVEVLMSEAQATELGVQAGETLIAYDGAPNTSNPRETPVQVAGVWRAADPDHDFWFFAPEVFDDLLLVPEATFIERLSPVLNNEINRAVWYLVMDGSDITTARADELAARSNQVARRAATLLPNLTNSITPADGLGQYRAAVGQLTVLLSAFNVPVILLILMFVALVVGLAVDQRRNEIAVIRSRGGTPAQVVGFAALEGIVLGAVALLLGAALALLLTQVMGKSRSFLDFSAPADLRVALTPTAWRAALFAVGLAVVAQIVPTLTAAQDTIITYKQEQARSMRRPWWQRIWLDVILLAVAAYGIYTLRQEGLTQAGESGFSNPLLFLIPGLLVVALTLLFVRVLPWLMSGISWLLAQTNSVGLLMASRQLARTPRLYAMPLILLILTASLAVVTASLAQTMDYQLYDASRYSIGADVNLRGAGIEFGGGSAAAFFGESETDEERNPAIFLPLDEYQSFPGIDAAARVGRFDSNAELDGRLIKGSFLGIDRAGFGDVAFWRRDFAPNQLGDLLNALATSPDALLVSEAFAQQNGLRPGDFFRLSVVVDGEQVPLITQIAGTFRYFPTWYPEEDGPLFVGNLETLFAQTGGEVPYEVWLNGAAPPDAAALDEALVERRLFGWTWREPYSQVAAEQQQPDRQGIFGLLSVGFIAAALLTVLGFFLYALFSLRQRFITLGILQAVGLTQTHIRVYLAVELAVLILSGLTLGTGMGILVSREFIPFWQVGVREAELVPPYLVEIAWPAVTQIYILFGLMFLIALVVLGLLLRRMKIFQAIKLGETV
jgi:putative ABC transport system permease protein